MAVKETRNLSGFVDSNEKDGALKAVKMDVGFLSGKNGMQTGNGVDLLRSLPV